jgi:hypothetical protein
MHLHAVAQHEDLFDPQPREVEHSLSTRPDHPQRSIGKTPQSESTNASRLSQAPYSMPIHSQRSSSWPGTPELGSFGPIGASFTPSRFRQFATVSGFTPCFRLSAEIGAVDRRVAARTARVVVALPWSAWPRKPPSHDGRKLRHHTPGLNT